MAIKVWLSGPCESAAGLWSGGALDPRRDCDWSAVGEVLDSSSFVCVSVCGEVSIVISLYVMLNGSW